MLLGAVMLLGTSLFAQNPSPEKDWSRKAVFYQVFVRSFYDGNGDGKGDLPGVTAKLDYLKDLGIGAIWLTPIYPSPTYHGYDVMDYKSIHPDFGTQADFDKLIKTAHDKGIRVILDWVVNHTSDQHVWFQKALAGDPQYKDYYRWSDTAINGSWGIQKNGKYAYFSFGPQSKMPDLNYENPKVHEEILDAAQFWLKKGVDGFRLDVAQYIGDGERVKTINWWKEFQASVAKTNPGAFIVGEVNYDKLSDFNLIAPYYAGMDAAFDFPVYNNLTVFAMGFQNDIITHFNKARNSFKPYQKDAMDALLLGNHDRQRIASFLKFDPARIRKAMTILLTLPGRPFIYYGDEIGMRAGHDRTQGDPNKREPMDWYTSGTGIGMPAMTKEIYTATAMNQFPQDGISVEEQLNHPDSLLNFVKKLIKIRKDNPVLWEGKLTRVGTPDGLFGYQLTQDKYNYNITVIHNQIASESRSVPLTANTIDLITGKTWKFGETLVIPPAASVILKLDGAAAPIGKYEIIIPPKQMVKLTINVTVPENTPPNAEMWMPNSSDGWQPAEILPKPGTKLKQTGPRTYTINVTGEAGTRMEYKFFRGGWETSETQADGNWNGNREFLFLDPETTIAAVIDGWRDIDYKGDKP